VPERHTQVLVVSGSLVGRSTSVLLASYGVPHLVIESHRGTAPRAAHLSRSRDRRPRLPWLPTVRA